MAKSLSSSFLRENLRVLRTTPKAAKTPPSEKQHPPKSVSLRASKAASDTLLFFLFFHVQICVFLLTHTLQNTHGIQHVRRTLRLRLRASHRFCKRFRRKRLRHVFGQQIQIIPTALADHFVEQCLRDTLPTRRAQLLLLTVTVEILVVRHLQKRDAQPEIRVHKLIFDLIQLRENIIRCALFR